MAALHNTYCSAHPGRNLFLYFFIAPMAHYHFALNPHAGHNVTIFSVTVGRLVFIHKIHINGIIWDFLVELCMQMHQGFSVLLQSQNPGLSR